MGFGFEEQNKTHRKLYANSLLLINSDRKQSADTLEGSGEQSRPTVSRDPTSSLMPSITASDTLLNQMSVNPRLISAYHLLVKNLNRFAIVSHIVSDGESRLGFCSQCGSRGVCRVSDAHN